MKLNLIFFQRAKRFSIFLIILSIQSLYPSKLAQAKHSSESPSLSNTTAQKTLIISQVNPIRGRWKIRHSNGSIVHESILSMYGFSGKMTTRYFDPRLQQPTVVEQTMQVNPSAVGLLIVGYRPVYSGTNILHPRYSPDTFLFRVDPNGSVVMLTCDTQKICSPIEITAL